MAREIAFRATGDAATTVGDVHADALVALARETRALLEPLLTGTWSAHVYRQAEEVVAFAPVPMGSLAVTFSEEAVSSISVAAELAGDGDDDASPRRHVQRRERLIQSIGDARERLQGRLASLHEEAAKATKVDELRERGDLIYAWLWQIAPGQTELTVDGTTIPLDPNLSAKENAQAYFERYRKARSANEHLPELVAQTETQLTYLDQLTTMVSQADGFAEIEALATEWRNYQGATAPSSRAAPAKRAGKHDKRPRPLLDRNGNAIYVGRTGAQNDFVTFDLAGADDTWLHARGVPGSHVVVRWHRPGSDEDPETIAAAAALAAYYSSARASARVEVDATKRRHVRKIKGAGPGMVTYRQERTIAVRPVDENGVKAVLGISERR
jgi:predicted ribosome quality control (RQC) complex YloA/Tae2 family protein